MPPHHIAQKLGKHKRIHAAAGLAKRGAAFAHAAKAAQELHKLHGIPHTAHIRHGLRALCGALGRDILRGSILRRWRGILPLRQGNIQHFCYVLAFPGGKERLHRAKIFGRAVAPLLIAYAGSHCIRGGILRPLLPVPLRLRNGIVQRALHNMPPLKIHLFQCMQKGGILNQAEPLRTLHHINRLKGDDAMKKDLRGYGRGEQRPNYESMAQNAMNSADPEQLKSMEDAMNYYGGKSEGELMEELMRGKSSGMIDEAKLNDVAARIAPMLTPEQLSRLSAVMERLRQ